MCIVFKQPARPGAKNEPTALVTGPWEEPALTTNNSTREKAAHLTEAELKTDFIFSVTTFN